MGWLACIALVAVALLLCVVPLNRLLLFGGTYRFVKTGIRKIPWFASKAEPVNEVVEFVKRAPNDRELRGLLGTCRVR